MEFFQGDDGREGYKPTDKNDAALLKMAEGGTFRNTTFPSGWKSPDRDMTARGGVLIDQ